MRNLFSFGIFSLDSQRLENRVQMMLVPKRAEQLQPVFFITHL